MKTIANLKTDLKRKISPAQPDDSRDIYGAIEYAGDKMLLDVKPLELVKTFVSESSFFSDVAQYPIPDEVDKDNIAEIEEINENNNVCVYVKNTLYSRNNFINYHGDNSIQVDYENNKKYIKMHGAFKKTALVLDSMDSLTENGPWLSTGNITNLTIDTLLYKTGLGSLRFNVNNSTNTGSLRKFLTESKDIETFFDKGSLCSWLYIPDNNAFNNIEFRFGTNISNYFSVSKQSFTNGENDVIAKLDVDVINIVGIPNKKEIKYIEIIFTSNANVTLTGLRIDSFNAYVGKQYKIKYQSQYLFIDNEGVALKRPVDDSTIVNLQYDTYNLFVEYCATELARELFKVTTEYERMGLLKKETLLTYKIRNKQDLLNVTGRKRIIKLL